MKKHIGSLLSAACLVALILYSPQAAAGGLQGIELCLKRVIPSLFPFLFLSGVLRNQESTLLEYPGRLLRLPSGQGNFLLAAFAGGYPLGAAYICAQVNAGRLSPTGGNRLLRFCGCPSPGFLFGMLAPLFSKRELFVLWVIQIFSAWLVSAIYPPTREQPCPENFHAEALPEILKTSIRTMGLICGWVVLFQAGLNVLRPVLPKSPLVQSLFIGLLEMTSGVSALGALSGSARFLAAQGILGFGGLCITLQTASAIFPMSILPYLQGKLLQTALGLGLAWGYTAGNPLPVLVLLAVGLYKMGFFQKAGSFFTLHRV